MSITVVTVKGQIVIPSRIRRQLNIKKGTKVFIDIRGDEIIMKPITEDYLEKLAGVLPGKGKSINLLNNNLN